MPDPFPTYHDDDYGGAAGSDSHRYRLWGGRRSPSTAGLGRGGRTAHLTIGDAVSYARLLHLYGERPEGLERSPCRQWNGCESGYGQLVALERPCKLYKVRAHLAVFGHARHEVHRTVLAHGNRIHVAGPIAVFVEDSALVLVLSRRDVVSNKVQI